MRIADALVLRGPARRVPVRARARAEHDLPSVDYEDAFAVDAPDARARSAEEWARTMLETMPALGSALLLGIWSAARVQLGPRTSSRHVLGLELARRSHDAVVLETRSDFGVRVQLVLLVEADRLEFASFLMFENALGRASWVFIAPLHRQAVPTLLGRAPSLPDGARAGS